MSGMSSILRILLYRDAFSPNDPKWRRGLPLGTLLSPKSVPLRFPLVARGAV